MNGQPALAMSESMLPGENDLVDAFTGPDDRPLAPSVLRPLLSRHTAEKETLATAIPQVVRGTGEAAPWDVADARIIRPAFPRRASQPRPDKFLALQRWEGAVSRVSGNAFVARLVDNTGAMPDQEAQFQLDEVSPSDLELVAPGAVFYWSIGYLDKPSGRVRQSAIKFRRLPAWSERELERIRERGANLRERLAETG